MRSRSVRGVLDPEWKVERILKGRGTRTGGRAQGQSDLGTTHVQTWEGVEPPSRVEEGNGPHRRGEDIQIRLQWKDPVDRSRVRSPGEGRGSGGVVYRRQGEFRE